MKRKDVAVYNIIYVQSLCLQSVGNKNGKLWTTDEEVSPEVLAKVMFIFTSLIHIQYLVLMIQILFSALVEKNGKADSKDFL